MKISRKQIFNGFHWAVAVVFLLLFVPPLIAPWLPVWDAAQSLAAKDARVVTACGKPGSVVLSRWFYTYRFSGEFEHAVFRGSVQQGDCERRFCLKMDRTSGPWRVSEVEFPSP